jgi:hypothetical protein
MFSEGMTRAMGSVGGTGLIKKVAFPHPPRGVRVDLAVLRGAVSGSAVLIALKLAGEPIHLSATDRDPA